MRTIAYSLVYVYLYPLFKAAMLESFSDSFHFLEYHPFESVSHTCQFVGGRRSLKALCLLTMEYERTLFSITFCPHIRICVHQGGECEEKENSHSDRCLCPPTNQLHRKGKEVLMIDSNNYDCSSLPPLREKEISPAV